MVGSHGHTRPTGAFGLKLVVSDQGAWRLVVEVGHVVLTSGLAAYLLSRGFEGYLGRRLYKGLREDWKEVRASYTQRPFRGTGPEYPRDPAILIHEPVGPVTSYHFGTKPMMVGFNNAFVGRLEEGQMQAATGKWSELQPMEIMGGVKVVGFPGTEIPAIDEEIDSPAT